MKFYLISKATTAQPQIHEITAADLEQQPELTPAFTEALEPVVYRKESDVGVIRRQTPVGEQVFVVSRRPLADADLLARAA